MQKITLQRHKFNLFPKASEEDFSRLLEDMRSNGYDNSLPIMLYQGAILDGWNRYCAATDLGLTPASVEFDGDDDAALVYTLRTNKRRNMSSSQWAAVAVQAEELMAAIRDAQPKGGRPSSSDEKPTQLVVEVDRSERETAHKVAEVFNTNRTYINEAAKLKETSPEAFEMVKAGDVSVPLAAQFAALPQEVRQEAITAIAEHHEPAKEVMREAVKKAHVANNSGNNEWYTPADYIALARAVMGGIDTDPATSEIANRTVQAAQIFTAEDNGLTKQWSGRVWCNPPYAQPLIAEFAEAIASKYETGEIEQACVLVNNGTETGWFQRMLQAASAVCFPSSRIRFVDPEGNPSGAPLQGQAVLYLGNEPETFASVFSEKGAVLFNG